MNKHPYLGVGQKVIYVDPVDKKNRIGTIIQVYNEDSAKIEHDNGTAVAVYGNEPGTFHFEQASPKEEHKKH